MKPSGFSYFHFFGKIYETMSNRQTANLHWNTPSENESDDNNNPTENFAESFQGEKSVETNTNPTDKTQQNHRQIPESSISEIVTGQKPNLSVKLQ